MIRQFINFNRKLSAALERHLPYTHPDPFVLYDETVAKYQHRAPRPIIADIGGGRSCSFVNLIDRSRGTKVVAVDISEEELSHNRDADEKRVADVRVGLPFRDGEVGLLVSRTLLEHVGDVEAFIADSSRVLCDGGYAIHLFPCRYAPFAIIGRLLPFSLAKSILHFIKPESVGVVEFPVFYDKCNYSAMKKALSQNRFRNIKAFVSYYQSSYFDAFFPAYLVSVLYEVVISTIGAKDLAAHMVVVAQR